MSKLLVVSEDEKVVRGLGKSSVGSNALEFSTASWSAWEAGDFTPDTADIVLLDFTGSEGIPTSISARIGPELQRRSSRTPVVLLIDIQQSAREVLQTLVEELGVTVMASQTGADPKAFQEFLEAILTRHTGDSASRHNSRKLPHSVPQLLPVLRNPNGRLDAKRVGELFGIPLRKIASAIEAEEAAVYKTPDAARLQAGLLLYERIAKALLQLVGSEEGLRIWLNSPEAELDNEVPRELLLNGEGEVVADLLEEMLTGMMS